MFYKRWTLALQLQTWQGVPLNMCVPSMTVCYVGSWCHIDNGIVSYIEIGRVSGHRQSRFNRLLGPLLHLFARIVHFIHRLAYSICKLPHGMVKIHIYVCRGAHEQQIWQFILREILNPSLNA